METRGEFSDSPFETLEIAYLSFQPLIIERMDVLRIHPSNI